MDNSPSFSEPISELVESFLDSITNLDSSQLSNSSSLHATLMYEIDTVVSEYLDSNNLASLDFVDLQQEFINSLAEELTSEINEQETFSILSVDNEGNYLISEVFEALEEYGFYHLDSSISIDVSHEYSYE